MLLSLLGLAACSAIPAALGSATVTAKNGPGKANANQLSVSLSTAETHVPLALPSETPPPSPSPTTSPTPTVAPTFYATVCVASANLRRGPEMSATVEGYARLGDVLPVYGRDDTGQWLLVDWSRGVWIAVLVVDADGIVSSLPVIAKAGVWQDAVLQPVAVHQTAAPTLPPASRETPLPTLFVTPTLAERQPKSEVSCNCTGPDLDCADFASQRKAQVCYAYCASIGYGDIFRLDKDRDGKACNE